MADLLEDALEQSLVLDTAIFADQIKEVAVAANFHRDVLLVFHELTFLRVPILHDELPIWLIVSHLHDVCVITELVEDGELSPRSFTFV